MDIICMKLYEYICQTYRGKNNGNLLMNQLSELWDLWGATL